MSKLRAAVIGLGVGEQHIAGFGRHPACEVTALCDCADDKFAMARAKYPHLRLERDARTLLTDPDIDVVSIATFDDVHCEQIVMALEHGKHVFVEKPICLLEAELVAIRAALKRRPRLKISSNLILRKSPRFLELRDWIRTGTLGDIFLIEADYHYGRLHKLTDGWRGKLPFYSVMHGGGIHMIDLVLWLTGQRALRVTALGNQIASAGSSFQNHDMVISLVQLENGAVAKISANFGCVKPHFHNVHVFGTAATYQNDWPDARLYRSRDPDVPYERVVTTYPGAHKGDLLFSFIEAIRTETEPEVGADDVFAAMSVSLAIEAASHAAGPVAVRSY